MLCNLKIRKYALIDTLDIDFHSGFSVVTGETGAGKSIMLGAINLILGGRADARSIKEGADKCFVEATFEESGKDVADFFAKNDFDFDGKECVVRREISKSGKSRAFINDTPATVSQLKELGQKLVDIHSQHQNLLVSGTDFQISVLDAVAQNTEIREDYVACYTKYKKARTELERLRNEISKKKEDEDYLRYSLRQFEAANLKENEEEELEAEQQRLSHAEEITEALAETCRTMDSEEGSVIDSLSRCAENISRISKFLPDAGSLSKRIDSVCIELRDIYGDLCGHSEDNDYNPERLQQVDERLSVIYDLERKYHTDSYVQLLKKEDELRSQLEIIDDGSEILEEKEKLCEKLQKAMLDKAATLTAARKEAAGTFARQMTARLVPLGMPDVRFKVETTPLPNADITGADDVKYLFSANKSSALRDIGDIASGGEIARVMLCIKAIVSEVKGLPTIVFDEIDTGVSGRIAEQMAKSMQCICKGGTQVICITHLPQIAARGDFHYLVYKSNDDDITSSCMEQLSEGMRLNEIAKMLSGSEITEAAISNAKELLNRKDKQ